MSNEQSQKYNAEEARRQNLVGKRIAAIRKARKMTQAEVCRALRHYDVSIQPAALSRWENGVTEPNGPQLLALCSVFRLPDNFRFLEDDVSQLEIPLSQKYASLVADYREYLIEHHAFESKRKNIRELQLPLLVPALYPGHSDTIPSYTYSSITVKETDIPYGTDFALRVPDGSMYPLIRTGSIIFCSFTDKLIPEDVGVFLYQRNILIRRYFSYEDSAIAVVLYPADPKLPAIPIDYPSQFTIIGRVLV